MNPRAIVPAGPNGAEIVSAGAAVALALLAGIAAWYAGKQLGEAKRLREQQTRPWVELDLNTDDRAYFITLTIANVGRTSARDMTFKFEPPLVSTLDHDTHPLAEEALLAHGIP